MSSPDPRFERILEAIVALARHDFGVRTKLEGNDEIAAIGSGLDMLAEELAIDVASRRELEKVLAERQAAEASLVHAGRLSMLGQVAAGVGHEINNPVTWVSLGLVIITRKLAALRAAAAAGPIDAAALADALDPIDTTLVDVREGMERIRVVANDLRTFARADDSIEPVSLVEVAQTSARLASAAFGSHATLELDLQDAPHVAVNRGRISQVATNLLVNAAQAVRGEDDAGRILVSTSEQSGGALLTVEDDGPGVPESLRRRIFEPFFTTKTAEEGTGLGLALVRKIIDGYRGDIRVLHSPTLGGARFEVWLPACASDANGPSSDRTLRPEGGRPLRILVVDDEPAMLRSMRSILDRHMNVEVACGGLEAIERLERDVGFDVILCDVDMADVTGPQLVAWVENHAPLLTRKIVLCSGRVLQDDVRDFIVARKAPFLEKPISADALERAMHRLAAR